MKIIKKTLFIIFLMVILTIKVNAGIGICHGKKMEDGYCKLDNPVIFSLPNELGSNAQNLFYKDPENENDKWPVLKFWYEMEFNTGASDSSNKENLLVFCIDGNYPSPTDSANKIKYHYARPINIKSSRGAGVYDYVLGSAFTILMNEMNEMKGKTANLQESIKEYYQVWNFLIRVLNVRFGHYLEGYKEPFYLHVGDSRSLKNIISELQNAYAQLSGRTVTVANENKVNTIIDKKSPHYGKLQQWYCQALLSPDHADHLSREEENHCKNILTNDKPVKPIDFEPVFNVETPTDVEYDNNKFSKTVKVTISNLKPFIENGYNLGKEPFFKITDVKCDIGTLNCKIKEAEDGKKQVEKGFNILEDLKKGLFGSADSLEFEVEISGNNKTVFRNITPKLSISYEYYHLMNSEVVTEIRYTKSEVHERQRMLLVEPFIQKRTEEISVNFDQMCHTKIESGKQTYWYGGQNVGLYSYIKDYFCCNLDPNLVEDHNLYEAYCEFEDVVKLNDKCDPNVTIGQYEAGNKCIMENITKNTPRSMNRSTVRQVQLQTIFNTGKNGIREKFENFNVDDETYKNYWDLPYSFEQLGIFSSNPYCRVFTSEDLDIDYPGVTVSANGSNFVFAKAGDKSFQQPTIEGRIQANLYINVKRWYKDYAEAINEEKQAYDNWQLAAAYHNALDKMESPGPCIRDGNCEVDDDIYKNYKPEYEQSKPDRGKFFDRFGNDLSSKFTLVKSCGCGTDKYPNPSAYSNPGTLESIYNTKVKERETLQKLKLNCENAYAKAKWKYHLAPELTFFYSQEVAGADGRVNTLIEPVPMKIARNGDADKYWHKVSSDPKTIRGHAFTLEDLGEVKNYVEGRMKSVQATGPRSNSEYKKEHIIYGDTGTGDWFVDDNFEYEEEVDKFFSFQQILYYKPDIYKYTITPSGQTAHSTKFTSPGNNLEIGTIFDVTIETRKGGYNTWFELKNAGHLMRPLNSPKLYMDESNAQRAINRELSQNKNKYLSKGETFVEGLFPQLCQLCVINPLVVPRCEGNICKPESTRIYEPKFFYRTISLDEVTPKTRKNSNWETEKGKKAKEKIQNSGITIYDDRSEYLEYSFVLTPDIMMKNRKANKETNYQAYNHFGLSCVDGNKECISDFVTKSAEESEKYIPGAIGTLNKTRAEKWKYYIPKSYGQDNGWKVGSIKKMIEDGYFDANEGYPDELNTKFIGKWR